MQKNGAAVSPMVYEMRFSLIYKELGKQALPTGRIAPNIDVYKGTAMRLRTVIR